MAVAGPKHSRSRRPQLRRTHGNAVTVRPNVDLDVRVDLERCGVHAATEAVVGLEHTDLVARIRVAVDAETVCEVRPSPATTDHRHCAMVIMGLVGTRPPPRR
eukprot:COSAG01_NODE_6878_length_3457_cov_1.360631_2_plen_103_part_00